MRIIVRVSEHAEIAQWLEKHGAKNLKAIKKWKKDNVEWGEISFDGGKVGRKPKIDKAKIIAMKEEGRVISAIAQEMGCSRAYVYKVLSEKR